MKCGACCCRIDNRHRREKTRLRIDISKRNRQGSHEISQAKPILRKIILFYRANKREFREQNFTHFFGKL